MYKILKDKGSNTNITLKNTETKAEVNLGRLSTDIIKLLESDGYSFETSGGTALRYTEEWELAISDSVGKDLGKLAMPIKRPVRVQKKKEEVKTEEVRPVRRDKQPVDVFNLIFGIE